MSLIRRRRRTDVKATPSLLAAEAAQREAQARRVVADRSGERLTRAAYAVGRHLEHNNFGPRLEAALREGPR